MRPAILAPDVLVPKVLTWGLALLVVAAPLPFGSVGPAGRLAVEVVALALTALLGVTALVRQVPLPPRAACFGLAGLLALGVVQIVPWPGGTLSADPGATASALRTGTAMAGTLLVATTVVAWRGGKTLAVALAVSAFLQGLTGVIVLASGHPAIWGIPKTAYLDSATGTFVNRNHFAAFLAAALPPAIGLAIDHARRARRRAPAGAHGIRALAGSLGDDGVRALLLALASAVGLAGLLLSYSRAGTAAGLLAVAATAVVVLRGRPVRGFALAAILVAIAAVPLLDLGAARLGERYAESGEDLLAPGGRASVWRDAAGMIAARPLAGFGFGTFTWTYPSRRSPEVRLHYSHAHEDLLQLGAEGGIGALLLAGLLLVPLARAGGRLLARNADPPAVGAAFGLAALLLHALVDFPLHIPADGVLACVLAGWLYGATWTARS